MTSEQISLARHALGLPNVGKQSYRNHFVAGLSRNRDLWEQMVADGNATKMDSAKARARFGGCDCYWLTRAGANAALQEGEKLDPEDFRTAA